MTDAKILFYCAGQVGCGSFDTPYFFSLPLRYPTRHYAVLTASLENLFLVPSCARVQGHASDLGRKV